MLTARAVVFEQPEALTLRELVLDRPQAGDVVVDAEWSGISTGTEKLLWSGRMPAFPGMGYPLVPGYETVGRVTGAGEHARHRIGERVFVPGARCFGEIRAKSNAPGAMSTTARAVSDVYSEYLADGSLLSSDRFSIGLSVK